MWPQSLHWREPFSIRCSIPHSSWTTSPHELSGITNQAGGNSLRRTFIEATPGNVIDYDRIRVKIEELNKLYPFRDIAIDRWNSTQLQTQLTDDCRTVVPFGQGYKDMSAPTKELGALVLSKRLRHGGNPVLHWMAGNVAVLQDAAGNFKPAKDKSADRIDGVVATIMALGRLMVSQDPWSEWLVGIWVLGGGD